MVGTGRGTLTMAATADNWSERRQQLIDEGWIFYEESRYNPTKIRGYSTAFMGGSPANRRKGNRPLFVLLAPQVITDMTTPWTGTMRAGISTLNPWVQGAAMPPDDADWAIGPTAHYLADDVNPTVWDELRAAETSPVASINGTYGNCSNADTAIAAIRDLFSRLSIPA